MFRDNLCIRFQRIRSNQNLTTLGEVIRWFSLWVLYRMVWNDSETYQHSGVLGQETPECWWVSEENQNIPTISSIQNKTVIPSLLFKNSPIHDTETNPWPKMVSSSGDKVSTLSQRIRSNRWLRFCGIYRIWCIPDPIGLCSIDRWDLIAKFEIEQILGKCYHDRNLRSLHHFIWEDGRALFHICRMPRKDFATQRP